MSYFETNANLREDQVIDIKNNLNQVLLDDFNVAVTSNKIVFYTDGELVPKCVKQGLDIHQFLETFGGEVLKGKQKASYLCDSPENFNNADITSGQQIYTLEQIEDVLELLNILTLGGN